MGGMTDFDRVISGALEAECRDEALKICDYYRTGHITLSELITKLSDIRRSVRF